MSADPIDTKRRLPWEEREVDGAGGEAARIGGRVGDEYLDPADRPLVEGGEGVSEGFELAEEDLIRVAETSDPSADPSRRAFTPEGDDVESAGYSEADDEDSSELLEGDK
jgi:hypothetical protein